MQRSRLCVAITTLIATFACSACHTTSNRDHLTQTASFRALPPDQQAALLAGELCLGMDTNAVSLGWGAPGEIVRGESESGREMRWLYYGSWTRQIPFWSYTPNAIGAWTLDARVDHQSQRYLKAVAVFREDRLIRWQKLPRPNSP